MGKLSLALKKGRSSPFARHSGEKPLNGIGLKRIPFACRETRGTASAPITCGPSALAF